MLTLVAITLPGISVGANDQGQLGMAAGGRLGQRDHPRAGGDLSCIGETCRGLGRKSGGKIVS